MATPIEALIDQSAQISRFASNSRYSGVPFAILVDADGREVAYVTRRFVPPPSVDPMDPVHTVTDGERPDHLAAQHLGDPERYWQLCDHNLTRQPWELTAQAGALVRLPGGGSAGNLDGFAPL